MTRASDTAPRCLVVEDEVLIGMFLDDSLCEAGFDVHWVASTASAFELLDYVSFDVAVLDVVIRSEPCVSLAGELKRRRIPFLVYSGHSRDCGLTAFCDSPWLEKPAEGNTLLAAVSGVMSFSDARPG